jgi:HEAT repeat protein
MQTDFATVFAQTTISREEIPSDIPLDVKEQIKKLYYVEPLITLQKDKRWIVRWTTVRALAAIKDTRDKRGDPETLPG